MEAKSLQGKMQSKDPREQRSCEALQKQGPILVRGNRCELETLRQPLGRLSGTRHSAQRDVGLQQEKGLNVPPEQSRRNP